MPLGKTEFLPGYEISYPLESLPKLFATLKTNSNKAFFEKLTAMDTKGGDGVPIEKYTEFIQIGLTLSHPAITYEETFKLVSKFYEEHGMKGIENLIVDAFADAKLRGDRAAVDKRRKQLQELEELETMRLDYAIHSEQLKLEETETKIAEKVADMGNSNPPTQNQKRKSKT